MSETCEAYFGDREYSVISGLDNGLEDMHHTTKMITDELKSEIDAINKKLHDKELLEKKINKKRIWTHPRRYKRSGNSKYR